MHLIYVPRGDLKALERIAYEFVEDSANSGIIYSEARFCPHLVIPDDVVERQKLQVTRHSQLMSLLINVDVRVSYLTNHLVFIRGTVKKQKHGLGM